MLLQSEHEFYQFPLEFILEKLNLIGQNNLQLNIDLIERSNPNIQCNPTLDHPHSNLCIFIDKRLIQNLPVQEEKAHLIARRTLQTLSVIGGFGGRVPYIELNLKLGGNNKVYGGILAFSNCTALDTLFPILFLRSFIYKWAPSPLKNALVESRIGPKLKKTIFVSSVVLGLSSQISFAYIAYKYNEPLVLNPDQLLMPSMIFLVDSWVTAYYREPLCWCYHHSTLCRNVSLS